MTTDEKPRVLLVDDESAITRALSRIFRLKYDITACDSGHDGLCALQSNDYAVIISDMRMPHMDGATFLTKARKLQPHTVRLLLTGEADMASTIRAINEGQIHSFISKPWDVEQLQSIVEDAYKQYQQQHQVTSRNQVLAAENEILQEVNESLEAAVNDHTHALKTSKKRLETESKKNRQRFQQLLDMVDTIIADRSQKESGHNKRIAFQSRLIAQSLKLDKQLCTQIYLAGLMADLGKVSVSDDILNKPEQQLDAAQLLNYQHYVIKGAELLATQPDLKEVAKIVRHQCEFYSGGGFPDRLKQDNIPIGSRILFITKDFDRLLLGLKQSRKYSVAEAKAHLLKFSGHRYDPNLVKIFMSILDDMPNIEHVGFDYAVTSERLKVGTVLAQDVLLNNGNLFLPRNTVFSAQIIERIKQHESKQEFNFTFFIQ